MSLKKNRARRHIPLPTGEMLILMALYENTRGLEIRQIARITKHKPGSMYTVLQRLRERGLVSSEIIWKKDKSGKKCRFSLVRLTNLGLRLTSHWKVFLKKAGQEAKEAMGWRDA